MLFIDNALCHPDDLQDKLSNINIVFLPKSTTSKTQPLDSCIIASWKCRYKKKLLRHVCSKVDGSNSASDIVKSVNLLMSIEWGRQAWDDVLRETIVKRTGLYPDEVARRMILLREKFQDCRNSLRQWKYPVLQKSF